MHAEAARIAALGQHGTIDGPIAALIDSASYCVDVLKTRGAVRRSTLDLSTSDRLPTLPVTTRWRGRRIAVGYIDIRDGNGFIIVCCVCGVSQRILCDRRYYLRLKERIRNE